MAVKKKLKHLNVEPVGGKAMTTDSISVHFAMAAENKKIFVVNAKEKDPILFK